MQDLTPIEQLQVLETTLLKKIRLKDRKIITPNDRFVLWAGDLVMTYWSEQKPHSQGVALLATSVHDRRYQRETLLALHPDNTLLGEDHFFVELNKAWGCATQADIHPGIPFNHLIVFKKDYEDKVVLQIPSVDLLLGQLTSESNCMDYDPGDPDGYGILRTARSEKFYNPFIAKDTQGLNDTREAVVRHLMDVKDVKAVLLNDRLTPQQTQFCLRLYLDGGADTIRLIKGYEIAEELLALLHLDKRQKPPVAGRRMMDLIGLFDRRNNEVELLECSRKGHIQFHVAFAKGERGLDQVAAYSQGTPLDFFEDCPRIGLKELFSEACKA
jgi:hypothetical protein